MTLRDPDKGFYRMPHPTDPGVEMVLSAFIDEADCISVKPNAYRADGGVYFIRCEGFIKIGFAGSMLTRIGTLQLANPFTLEGLAFMSCGCEADALALEQELHQQFATYRVRGEWFHDVDAIRDHIVKAAEPWPPRR